MKARTGVALREKAKLACRHRQVGVDVQRLRAVQAGAQGVVKGGDGQRELYEQVPEGEGK